MGFASVCPGALVFIVTVHARVSQVYFVPFQAVTSITKKFRGCAACLGLQKPVQISACACFEQLDLVQSIPAYGGAVPLVLVSEVSHWRGGHSHLLELALFLCRCLLNCHLQPIMP